MRVSCLLLSLAAIPCAAQRPWLTPAEVQRQIAIITNDMKQAEPWTSSEGRHIVLDYVPSSAYRQSLIDELRNAFDGALESDCKVLQLDPPENKVTVFLFPSPSELGRAMKVPQPVNDGLSLGGWSAIPDEGKGLTQALKNKAAHELGHALVGNRLGPYGCPFISEGIAIFLQAKDAGEAWTKHPVLPKGVRLKLLALNAKTLAEYRTGAGLFAYLYNLDHGNPRRIKAFLRQISRERLDDLRSPNKLSWLSRVDRASEAAYGKSMDQLEDAWRHSRS